MYMSQWERRKNHRSLHHEDPSIFLLRGRSFQSGSSMCQAFWCLHFKSIHFLCVLEKRQKSLQWNIFLEAKFLPPECGHRLSVFQKQHRLVFLCHFPAAFATSASERYKGLRNTAKEKGIPEATRRVVTSECVCSVLQDWV